MDEIVKFLIIVSSLICVWKIFKITWYIYACLKRLLFLILIFPETDFSNSTYDFSSMSDFFHP